MADPADIALAQDFLKRGGLALTSGPAAPPAVESNPAAFPGGDGQFIRAGAGDPLALGSVASGGTPAAPMVNPVDPSVPVPGTPPRMGTTVVQTPEEAAADFAAQAEAEAPPPRPAARGGGVFRPAGPPAWLKKEMGAEASAEAGLKPHRPGDVYTPDERAAYNEIETDAYGNLVDQGEADEQARAATWKAVAKQVQDQEAVDAEMAQQQRQRLRHLQSMEAKFAEMAEAIQADPIDSNRMWNKSSTGDQILSVFGMVLSGAAGGPEGAKWAVDTMEKKILRDIDEQKANKALMAGGLAAQGSLIELARTRFDSEAEIDAAMRETAYRRAKMELERFADFAQSPVREAQRQALMLELDAKILDASRMRRLESDNQYLQRMAAMAGPRPVDPRKKRIQDLEFLVKEKELTGKLEGNAASDPLFVAPGLRARSESEATKMRQDLAALDAADRQFADLQDATEKASSGAKFVGGFKYPLTDTPVSEEGDRLETKRNLATGALGVLSGSGVVNPGEYPRLRKAITSGAGIKGARDVLGEKRKGVLSGAVVVDPDAAKNALNPVKVKR